MKTEQLELDLKVLKDFILGFTSRDTHVEWEAFKRIRAAISKNMDIHFEIHGNPKTGVTRLKMNNRQSRG